MTRVYRQASCRRHPRGSVCLLMGLLVLTGCGRSLAGRWQLVNASPGREVFALDDVEFTKGGQFTATATLEGRTRQQAGAYRYNGVHLVLLPSTGGQQKYNAQLSLNTLRLSDGDRRVTLERE
ncbi:MAG: hypothetical protein JXO22_07625 [Phycisphaerae bacterium]|nr:hypothetical protein [Phycisphaerae bacterium]